ncbi:MAG: hypothetical protein H7Y88_04080 [Phycisphaerales bacterium]|nr:hypothetical protein [Phycisphaerales bacterium]
MVNDPVYFVIPTYRLKDVGETVRVYDENFRRNGHDVRMVVFDDSSIGAHEKYFASLQEVKTHNDLLYVGPREKEQFIAYINSRLKDRALGSLVRDLFRPSYGGNRNVALMYTLGSLLVSSDDDMRPRALVEDSPESLELDEVARGKIVRASDGGFTRKSFDLLTAFLDALGKPVSEVPANYLQGDHVADTAMDLETNTSMGLMRANSLLLRRGSLPADGVAKVAQTFRSGTNDIDALDYVELFLGDPTETDLDALNETYVLVNWRPVVTKNNWRIDCGVAGYDNRDGLPPFFPTRLRFEDYIYRLWIQQPGVAAAHVDAAQTHLKSNYMRSPLASEVFNEEIANLLKRKFKGNPWRADALTVTFDYDGEVTLADCEEILARVRRVYHRALAEAGATSSPGRASALTQFATTLERAFYGFEPDFFQQNVARIVDDVVNQIKACIDIWPRLIEICLFQKSRAGGGLPATRICPA